MAKSKARTAKRAAAVQAPRIETEAEKIRRLRLARAFRDLGLLPAPGTLGASRAPDAPIRACDAEGADAGPLPRLHLADVPKPDRARPPMPAEAQLRGAVSAWVEAHGKPETIKGGRDCPAEIAALLASAKRRALGPSEAAKLSAFLAAKLERRIA